MLEDIFLQVKCISRLFYPTSSAVWFSLESPAMSLVSPNLG